MTVSVKTYLLQYNSDGTLFNSVPTPIRGGSNGTPIIRTEAPFNSTEWGCTYSYGLATGKNVPIKSVPFQSTTTVNVDGVDQTWYAYELPITTDETDVSRQDSKTQLNLTVQFTNKTDPNMIETMDIEVMSVGQNVNADVPQAPINEIQQLQDQIDDKRFDDPTNYNAKPDIESTDIITYWDATGGAPVTGSAEDWKNFVNEGTVGRVAFPTGFDNGINDPVAGFGNFTDLVELVTDPRYPIAGATLVFTTTLSNTFEAVTSSMYPATFLIGDFINLAFTNSFTLGTDGTSTTLKIEYYKLDNPDDLVGTFLGSSEITFSNGTPELKTKGGVLATEFNIDPNLGELLGSRIFVKSDNIGDTITAPIGGVNPQAFTTWDIPAGSFSASKMNIIVSPSIGDIVEVKADGNVKSAGYKSDDVARLSQDQSLAGLNTFDELVTMLQGLLLTGDLNMTGDLTLDGNLFVINGSGTEILTDELRVEDLIATYAKGNILANIQTGHEWEIGPSGEKWAIVRNADGTFRIGLTTLEKLVAFMQEAPTNNIAVYNTVTGELDTQTPTQIKTLLSLENVDNTSDANKPVSDATQVELDKKMEVFTAENSDVLAGQGTVLNATGSTSLSQDGVNPNQINIFTPVGGTGTGQAPIGETGILGDDLVNPVSNANPLTLAVALVEYQVLFINPIQSLIPDIFFIDVATDTIDIDYLVNQDVAQQYKATAKVIFENPNTSDIGQIEFITKLDGAIVDTQLVEVGARSVPNDGVMTTEVFGILTVNKLLIQQGATFFFKPINLVNMTVVNGSIEFWLMGVIGESVLERMFTPEFANNGTGSRVDRSTQTDGVIQYVTTNPQLADLESTDILPPLVGTKYLIEMQPTMDGSQITWTKMTAGVKYNVYEPDGVTVAIGTDYILLNALNVIFEGTKYIIDKSEVAENVVYNNEASGLNADDVQEAIDEQKIFQELANALGGESTYTIQSSAYQVGDAVTLWLHGTLQREGEQYTFDTGTQTFTFLDFVLDNGEDISVQFVRTGAGGGVFFTQETQLDLTGSAFDLGATKNEVTKQSGIVHIYLVIAKTGNWSANDIIGTLPIGYRPSVTFTLDISSTFNNMGVIEINSNGIIKVVEEELIPTKFTQWEGYINTSFKI